MKIELRHGRNASGEFVLTAYELGTSRGDHEPLQWEVGCWEFDTVEAMLRFARRHFGKCVDTFYWFEQSVSFNYEPCPPVIRRA